jgi:hypothetical protein
MAAADSGEFAVKVSGLISDLERAATDIHCDDTTHELNQIHQSILQDNVDRFKLWAGSLGAFHPSSDPRSLAHRLRKAPQVRSRVNDLLAALSESLDEGKSRSSIQHEKVTSLTIYSVLHESSEYTDGAIREQQTVTSTQDELDLLDMLGLTEDESAGSCAEISHACQKVAEDISHLFKVAAVIGKSIARDRYARAETASKEKFDDHYDVAHVKAKFKHGKAPDWLMIRLGQAITKRRQYIKYVREHRSRIDSDSQQWGEPDLPHVASPMDSLQVKGPPKAITLASRPSQMPTMATTVVSNALLNVVQTIEDDRSVTTAHTSSFDDDADQKLFVPPLTDYTALGREFLCPFCPTATKFNSQSSWK